MVSMHEKFIPDTSEADVTREGRQSDKIRAWVHYLPSFSEIEADVVAVNNYFTSEGSNIVSLSTLDDGRKGIRHFVNINMKHQHQRIISLAETRCIPHFAV